VKILIGPVEKAYGSMADLISDKPWFAEVVPRLRD